MAAVVVAGEGAARASIMVNGKRVLLVDGQRHTLDEKQAPMTDTESRTPRSSGRHGRRARRN